MTQPEEALVSDPSPPLLSITKAAERLGVARKTLTRWIDAGDVRAVRLGERHWVSAAEVDRLLRAREES